MERFGKSQRQWLQTFLALPHGTPSHDTFGRVLARLNPQRFQECFLSSGTCCCTRLGVTPLSWLSAQCLASRTHATRCRVRIAAKTCVKSVRCVPRAFTHPRALQAARKGLEEPLAGLLAKQLGAKIMPQDDAKAWVRQVEAERKCPIHAAADGISDLAVREPFDRSA